MKPATFIIFALIIIASTSCKKSTDSANDYASKIAGTYGGAVPPGILHGKLVLTRQSDNKVKIDRNGTIYENATVSQSSDSTYHVALTTAGTTISGDVKGTIFDCYFDQLRFYGVKQ